MIKNLLRIFCALLGTFVSTGADAAEKPNISYLILGEWGDFESGHIGQPKDKPYERKNFLKQIRARQKDDAAWVSYWNKAEIRHGAELRTFVWLESAVMVREVDRWKV